MGGPHLSLSIPPPHAVTAIFSRQNHCDMILLVPQFTYKQNYMHISHANQ